MNYSKVVLEIGVVETSLVLMKHLDNENITGEAYKFISLPTNKYDNFVDTIVKKICDLDKENIMLLSPEIAILERLAMLSNKPKNIFICISNEVDNDTFTRIKNNMPENLNITIIRESIFPKNFRVNNSAILVFGYTDYSYAIISKSSHRMMNLYGSFYGRKIIVSCNQDRLLMTPYQYVKVNINKFFNEVL